MSQALHVMTTPSSRTIRTCLFVLVLMQGLIACSDEPEQAEHWPEASCEEMDCPDASRDMSKEGGQDMPRPLPDQGTSPPIDQGSSPFPSEDMSSASCQGGDGTCPAGCNLSNDQDCVPDCRDPSSWPSDYAQAEAALLTAINAARAQGANCGSRGSFSPAGPVQMNGSLQIAARCHSVDMVEHIGGLDHTGSDGSSFSQRAKREGYTGAAAGENIAAGNSTAERTIAQWMDSDGHCANIMKADIDRIGTGYFKGDVRFTHYWTLVTGRGGGS